MKPMLLIAIIAILAASLPWRAVWASSSPLPLQTVAFVDLKRYTGIWYEIARYPNSFQRGCLGSTASYTLREDGEIDVVNSCLDAEDGRLRQAKGRAWVVDTSSNARLKVSFFWPFRGDYWIIDLGNDYEYAVIGTPNRKYFWILARSATMDDTLFSAIMQRAAMQGFDPSLVTRVGQEAQ